MVNNEPGGSTRKNLNRLFYRLLLWQENRRSLKRLDPNSRFVVSAGVNCVAAPVRYIANLACVESAFATLQTKELFLVSASQVGKGKLRETSDYDD